MSIASMMPSNHLILCCPLLLLPSIFSSIRVFSNESVLCIRWPKYWIFSFSISPSNEYSGLISLWMDWLDLLAVQGTLKRLLQHPTVQKQVFLQKPDSHSLYYLPVHVLRVSTTSLVRNLGWDCMDRKGKRVPGWGGGRFQAPISLRKGQSPTLLPSLGTFSSPSPSAQ